jgi:hypothetical protein
MKNMIVYALFASFLSGCLPEVPIEAKTPECWAVHAEQSVLMAANIEPTDCTGGYLVAVVDAERFQEICDLPPPGDGCRFTAQGGQSVIVLADYTPNLKRAFVHEYTHHVLLCETGDGDGTHSDPLWDLSWVEIRDADVGWSCDEI